MKKPMVWNRRDQNTPVGAIYVGRPTKWGNPFKIGKDGTREEVIRKYREYLTNSSLIHEIRELKGYHLECWCSPLPCHVDVLLELANK